MRNVSENAAAAIVSNSAHTVRTRLTVYKSRIYFDETTEDWYRDRKTTNPTLAVVPAEDTVGGLPYNMAVSLVNRPDVANTEPSSLAVWSVGSTVDPAVTDGLLFNGVAVDAFYPDKKSRIGVWNLDNHVDFCSVWYRTKEETPRWVRQEFALEPTEDYNVFPASWIAPETYSNTLNTGSIYPVSYTECVILDIYQGAIRVSFIDSDKVTHSSHHRFFNPTKVLDASGDDVYLTHYAGAVKLEDGVYVYFTDYQGAVKSIKYTFTDSEKKNGTWSDIHTSIPQDLSQFEIGNVFEVENRIFLCGKFYREEQFASSIAYTMLTWSDDGVTFTMSRRTLVTLRNFRWQAVFDPSTTKTDKYRMYFISPGPVYYTSSPYQVVGEQAENVIVELNNLQGSPMGEFQATAVSGAEQYFNNSNIEIGSYAKLELLQNIAGGEETIKYHDTIVSGYSKGVRDGARTNVIMLQTDGIWHTSTMSHPFYMEFQGKQSVYDNFTDQGGMVHASVGTNPRWSLSVSFWTEDNNAFIFQSHPKNTTTDHMTVDLLQYFSTYPTFGSKDNYEVRLYGWSRAGIAESNPNLDGTNHSTLNDDMYALYEVCDPETGIKEIKVSEVTHLISKYRNFPQTYYNSRSGSIPVIYSIPNPGEGKQITRLGMRLISKSLGPTTYCLERIEISKLACEPISGFTTDDIQYGTDGTGGKIVLTKKAIPQILFANTPYSAFNFDQKLQTRIKGIYSVSGLVGLASDKMNFVTGYAKLGKMVISKFSEGIETVLASRSTPQITENTKVDIRFWHSDGLMGVEYKLATTLAWPEKGSQLVYLWDNAHGAMVKNDDLYHVGTYSFIDPPRFRITGLNSKQSVVGVLPSDKDPSTNTSDFSLQFPASGQIDIDDVVYNYSGKVNKFKNNEIRGPFQLRNLVWWDSKYARTTDGSDSFQGGLAIEFLMFDWTASKTKYRGAIIACNSGNAWVNDETQWIPWITTNGQVIILRNRSRHYSDTMPEWYASGDERVYVTNGLTGISPVVVSETEYMHTEGSWAFKHSEDKIELFRYSAASGEEDQTIHNLLDIFSKISGTSAEFLGDYEVSESITADEIPLQAVV